MSRKNLLQKSALERTFSLAPAEAAVLELLLQTPGAPVANTDLIAACATNSSQGLKILRVRMCNLRSKLAGVAKIVTLKTAYMLESGAEDLERLRAGSAQTAAAR